MRSISGAQLELLLDYPSLVESLRQAFRHSVTVPQRHHHDYNQNRSTPSTLLLMPAWIDEEYLGVKIVTISPENASQALPTIQGQYLLFDASNGTPLAEMDMATLTNLRTAATSALAGSFLSRRDARVLLMVGTGSLAPYLIRAHTAVRPIERILVWGRNVQKARAISKSLEDDFSIQAISDLAKGVALADIISCATMSMEPLIMGQWLKPGQHLDLVGAYRPTMREADDEAIRQSKVFYDTQQGIYESGDLAIPLRNGILAESDLMSDLSSLCRRKKEGRKFDHDITLFKSVGHALEDLAAAKLAYQRLEPTSKK